MSEKDKEIEKMQNEISFCINTFQTIYLKKQESQLAVFEMRIKSDDDHIKKLEGTIKDLKKKAAIAVDTKAMMPASSIMSAIGSKLKE